MKYILIFLFIPLLGTSQIDSTITIESGYHYWSQSQSFLLHHDCGTWVQDTTFTTEWMPVDTLGRVTTDTRNWIYDKERYVTDLTVTAEYAPCGRGYPDLYETIRICSLTGIRQRSQRVITYRYVPKKLSPYQKAVKRFRK